MAPGFCTCTRDFPERRSFHPPEHATWHYLCDKPVLPPERPAGTFARFCRTCGFCHTQQDEACPRWAPEPASRIVPTGTGWPDEAQRIAEVYADARAELDRGL